MGAILTRAVPSYHREASIRTAQPWASPPPTSSTSRLQNWPLWPLSRPLASCEDAWDTGLLQAVGHHPSLQSRFVLDTTGSMGKEINAAKMQAYHIVEHQQGSPADPVHYVLVPFHDPGFGPVFTTSDPDRFWQNSVRSKLCGVEMSLRCACQSWRFALPASLLLHPPFQVLPRGGGWGRTARAFLGPHPFPPSEPGPTSFTQGPRCCLCPTHSYSCYFHTGPSPPCELALLHKPPLSDIFVFTDASPTDTFLTNQVESLTRDRHCRVSVACGRPSVSHPGMQEAL